MREHFLEPLTDTRNESPIRVENHQTELSIMKKANDPTVRVKSNGRNFTKAHLGGGDPDLGEHSHGLLAECPKINPR